MPLLILTIAIITGCYACSESQLRQGDTSKAGNTVDPGTATGNQEGNKSKIISRLLEEQSNPTATHTQQIKPVINDRPLDILLVIDSSVSMSSVHKNLSANLNSLLDKVKESNWRIVITSSTYNDCLRAVINKGDPDYTQRFTTAIDSLTYSNLLKENKWFSTTEDIVRMATKALPTVAGSKLHYRLPLRSPAPGTAPEMYKVPEGVSASSVKYDPSRHIVVETTRGGTVVIPDTIEETNIKPPFQLEKQLAVDPRPTWCTADVAHKNAGETSPRAHWLRDQSMLVVFLITDEDVYSGDFIKYGTDFVGIGCGCDVSDVVRSCRCLDTLWQRISALRKPRDNAKIYGILSSAKIGESSKDYNFSPPLEDNFLRSKFYLGWHSANKEKLFDEHWSVDMSDKEFANAFKKISDNVAKQMRLTYSLEYPHDNKTSEIIIIDNNKKSRKLPATAYRIDGYTLIFNKNELTPNSETIEVTYSYETSN